MVKAYIGRYLRCCMCFKKKPYFDNPEVSDEVARWENQLVFLPNDYPEVYTKKRAYDFGKSLYSMKDKELYGRTNDTS